MIEAAVFTAEISESTEINAALRLLGQLCGALVSQSFYRSRHAARSAAAVKAADSHAARSPILL